MSTTFTFTTRSKVQPDKVYTLHFECESWEDLDEMLFQLNLPLSSEFAAGELIEE